MVEKTIRSAANKMQQSLFPNFEQKEPGYNFLGNDFRKKSKKMNILVACEHSGTVRDAFIKKGHNAVSCDLLPTDSPGPHYEGDVRDIINDGWDMLIAHPECTYLTNSGVRWLSEDASRWPKLFEAADFFKMFLDSDIPKKCIENPIPHKYAKRLIGSDYSQIIHPYMFGHKEMKSTCLWLENLPKLLESKNVKKEMMLLPKNQQQRLHYLPPSKDRWKLRSKTYPGIANAMAEFWG